jgi:putative flavoprotein involved in K+ transport
MPRVDTLIVGAGQAGLALSRELSASGVEHVLLERGRVAQRWRERWPSLTLLTPNWMNRLPGDTPIADPDGYLTRDALIARLEAYAAATEAPVLERTRVLDVRRGREGLLVATDGGTWRARNVVVATGAAAVPKLPGVAAGAPPQVAQLHAAAYRCADALPPGGVLVVGAGPSGQQLALELRRAGRTVVLAAGRHARMVRRHRGADAWCWLRRIGELDRTIDEVADPAAARRAASLVLTGANGGEDLGLGVLRRHGVLLAGRLVGWDGATARFGGDLGAVAAAADARMRRLLDRFEAAHVRAHAQAASLAFDAAPGPAPLDLGPGVCALDLPAAGISTIVWATGFTRRYDWLPAEAVGPDGELRHRRGVTPVPGLLALGLPFQHRRTSHMIGGVGADAAHLAGLIAGAGRAAVAA